MSGYDVRKASAFYGRRTVGTLRFDFGVNLVYRVCRIVQKEIGNLPEAPRSRAMHIRKILSNLKGGHFGFNYDHA
jgi:hypothetical protein